MAFRANGMDFQSRVPLPGIPGQDYDTWKRTYGSIVLSRHRTPKLMEFVIRGEMVVKTKEIVVHTFNMGDVEDPDLMAAEPLWNWQQSPQGQWVMENAMEAPVWHRMVDVGSFGHKYLITATFQEKKLTEYYLRFGNIGKES